MCLVPSECTALGSRLTAKAQLAQSVRPCVQVAPEGTALSQRAVFMGLEIVTEAQHYTLLGGTLG